MQESYYDYDIFGSPITGNYTTGSDYGYLGKTYDSITGLYNYGYRDYSPQTVRFTTVDPIRDGSNWFVYVNNDPVNYVDLWGLRPTYGATSRDIDEPSQEAKNMASQIGIRNSLLQGLQGGGEVIVGVGVVYTGVKAEVVTGGFLSYSVGQAVFTGITIGATLIADGIQLLSGAIQGEERQSVLPTVISAVIIDGMFDVGNGLHDFVNSKQEDK